LSIVGESVIHSRISRWQCKVKVTAVNVQCKWQHSIEVGLLLVTQIKLILHTWLILYTIGFMQQSLSWKQ